jgi:hypothetical protein
MSLIWVTYPRSQLMNLLQEAMWCKCWTTRLTWDRASTPNSLNKLATWPQATTTTIWRRNRWRTSDKHRTWTTYWALWSQLSTATHYLSTTGIRLEGWTPHLTHSDFLANVKRWGQCPDAPIRSCLSLIWSSFKTIQLLKSKLTYIMWCSKWKWLTSAPLRWW